jgi:hypothetical protein
MKDPIPSSADRLIKNHLSDQLRAGHYVLSGAD